MVIMTARVSKSKLIAIGLIVLVIVILLVVCLNNSGASANSATPESTSDAPSQLKTDADRAAYLASFGWEVSDEPVQTQEVRIPTEASDVFERYNDLQRSQGFDLHEYAGKNVHRYVYEIKNYPDSGETWYATLLVYKNAVIGGDVCSSAQGGRMHGLAMPK